MENKKRCTACRKVLNAEADGYISCGAMYCTYSCYSDFVKAIIKTLFRENRRETYWHEAFD